jgi:hypothetical protein
MHRNLFAFAVLLAALSAGFQVHADTSCTAGNANATAVAETPTSAFTDNNDGTVTHNLTGLMWNRCAEGQTWGGSTCTGSATALTWAEALAQARDSSFAGHTDWRLPNIKELESIVESCGFSPSINTTLFPTTPVSVFWSGSSYVPNPPSAWGVYFFNGDTGAGYKTNDYYVRLVRGGQIVDSFDAQAIPPAAPTAIPTLSEWGVILLAGDTGAARHWSHAAPLSGRG